MTIRTLLVSALILAAGSCNPPSLNAFEKNTPIPGQAWSYLFKPQVDFDITDTASAYNVAVVCRHVDAYAYKNLWVFIATRKPGDSIFRKERFELTLQDNSGRWYGTGMDDIWEQRIPLYTLPIHFSKAGTYTVEFEQNMRDNPLKGILDIGLRVEKIP